MKNKMVKDVMVFIALLSLIYVLCLFLPEKIPVHFNVQGKADLVLNKHYLMFGVVIPYSLYWQFLRHKRKG